MSAGAPPRAARRSAEERAQARALGVDRYGRPTARALGISPRQLRSRNPDLTRELARDLSIALLRRARRRGARGAAPLPESPPVIEQAVKAGNRPTPEGLTG